MSNNNTEKPTEESNWIGPSGQRWLANVDLLEQMVRPVGHALLERAAIPAGENVIEIGCGAGELTLEIAHRVGPAGCVTGLDISPPLVAEASRRAAELPEKLPVRFVCGDAARSSVSAAPADRLVSRFGIMFFSEPYAAFAHLHSLLKLGGRFDFACWTSLQKNAWMLELRTVFAEHFDVPKPVPRAPGPFAFQEPEYLRDLLGRAKFKSVEIAPWNGLIPVGGPGSDPEAAADYLMKATSLAKFISDAPQNLRHLVRRKLRDRLHPYLTGVGVQMPASVWLVTAVA